MIGHVALVGMPGSGKSTVGPLIAARLGLPFFDSDTAVEAREGLSVAALFAARGEAGFRIAEHAAIAALLAGPPAVLALGGGAFADPPTRALVRRGATTLWLRASLPVLASRVDDGRGRPLLAGDPAVTLARLDRERGPAYAQAELAVDADAPAAAVAMAATDLLSKGVRVACVPVASPEYEVRIGGGLLADCGRAIATATGAVRVCVVTDANVAGLYLPSLLRAVAAADIAATSLVVAPGEASKGWDGLRDLVEAFAAAGLARADVVVALGGGVVGDLAGFAAAIYMRGLRWVQLPTTLLAQVDSSVGGKTAIDLAAGKNLAGAFHDPALVIADTALLATLPPRERRSGLAEVIKYGLIGEPRFFDWLEHNAAELRAGEPRALGIAVTQSVRAKARIVTADPREGGRRALLNLGHTFGHALEAETGFGDLLTHGEAIALGSALAFRYSVARGLCPAADAARAEALFRATGLPTRLGDIANGFDADRLIERMRGDKKAGSGGALTLILAHAIGQAFVARDVDAALLHSFLMAEGARADASGVGIAAAQTA